MKSSKKKILSPMLKEVYKSFGVFADYYKVDFHRFLESLYLIKEAVRLRGPAKLLDIACGPGILVAATKQLGFDSTGVDKYIFPDNKNRYFNINDIDNLKQIWARYDINILPLDYQELEEKIKSQIFDVITSDCVIEHLTKSPKVFFSVTRRLLKDGGYFLMTTPNLTSLLRRIRFLCGYSCMWDFSDYWQADLFLGHTREFTVSEIEKMCLESGFKIIKLYTKNVFPTGSLHKIGLLRKVIRLIAVALSRVVPHSGDMVYLLAQKKFN